VSESALDFPALRGNIADFRPVVAVDSREVDPVPITRLKTIRKGLYTGDYALAQAEWAAAIERKTVSDLVGSISHDRERFERELVRLRGYPFRRLLIVGTREAIEAGNYHSNMKPRAVLATLSCFEIRYQVPVTFCATPEIAGRQIESWLFWCARELLKTSDELLKAPKDACKD